MAQRLGVSGQVTANLLADFFGRAAVIDRVKVKPQTGDGRGKVGAAAHVMVEHHAMG